MNTLYLVRHGENTANITKEFSYKLVDYSLTPKGIQQAEQTAAHFKDKNVHEIYSSPLKRAFETAEIIAKPLTLPVNIVENFRELNVGSLEMQPPTLENWQIHNRVLENWYNGNLEAAFPSGENFLMAVQRAREGLEQILRHKDNKNIIIVGHGGIFKAVVASLCHNLNIDEFIPLEKRNCSITEIEVGADGKGPQGTLKCWGTHSHLSGEAAQFVHGTIRTTESEKGREHV